MEKKKQTISVALAVFNEELTLGKCLESVRGIADEIIVVDGESTDRTVEIAKKYGAHVIETSNQKIFHINKQKALDAAKSDWILQLDADERITPALAHQIMDAIQGHSIEIYDKKKLDLFMKHQSNVEKRDGAVGTNEGDIAAYFIPRLNFFLGGFLRHGGVYPDGVIRLMKKGKAHFPSKSVHEQIKIDGKIGWLSEDLLHYGDPTFSRYLQRSNRYTSLTAQEYKNKNLPLSIQNTLNYMFVKPFVVWCMLFFRHKGFLDGFPGFVFALFSGLHYPVAYMKYWEIRHAA